MKYVKSLRNYKKASSARKKLTMSRRKGRIVVIHGKYKVSQ